MAKNRNNNHNTEDTTAENTTVEKTGEEPNTKPAKEKPAKKLPYDSAKCRELDGLKDTQYVQVKYLKKHGPTKEGQLKKMGALTARIMITRDIVEFVKVIE